MYWSGLLSCVILAPMGDTTYFGSPDEFDDARRVLFLHNLVRWGGDVKKSLDDVSVDPVVALRAYKADPVFKAAWDEAIEASNILIEHTAIRRAGYTTRTVMDPNGNPVEVEDKPSDKLVQVMLKARKPEVYSERIQVTGKDGGPLQVRDQLIEQILELARAGVKDAETKG